MRLVGAMLGPFRDVFQCRMIEKVTSRTRLVEKATTKRQFWSHFDPVLNPMWYSSWPHLGFILAHLGNNLINHPEGVQTQETKYDGADYDYDADDDDEGDNDGTAHDGVCDFGADDRRW